MSGAHPLKTDRLRLVPTTPSHADLVYEKASDERMWTFFPHLRPQSIEEMRAVYQRWARGAPSPDSDEMWENWICFTHADDVPVGGMQATILGNGEALIAYAIYVDYQGQGYAREASLAVIEHLREAHRIERVVAEMNRKNVKSIALAASLGFRRAAERAAEDEYVYELVL